MSACHHIEGLGESRPEALFSAEADADVCTVHREPIAAVLGDILFAAVRTREEAAVIIRGHPAVIYVSRYVIIHPPHLKNSFGGYSPPYSAFN